MKYPRPTSSFDSIDEWDAWWDDRNREADMLAQAADDASSEFEEDDRGRDR